MVYRSGHSRPCFIAVGDPGRRKNTIMRSSSLALVSVLGLAASFVALQGCSLDCTGNSCTAKTVPEWIDGTPQQRTADTDWNGTDEISISNDGVNPLTGTGGVTVNFDASATKITATATISGRADTLDEAKLSWADAVQTFQITSNSVVCRHGKAHGTSTEGGSGCKSLTVTVPAGTAQKPLKLKIGSGMGGVRFTGNAPTVSGANVDSNGLGDVNVKFTPTKDARIVVTGEDEVVVGMPANFSAQKITLTVDEDAKFIISDFQGMENLKSYPTSGATADAMGELNVTSKGILSSDTVTISKF